MITQEDYKDAHDGDLVSWKGLQGERIGKVVKMVFTDDGHYQFLRDLMPCKSAKLIKQ